MLSLLIACAASVSTWVFKFASFLSLPGALLTGALFGQIASQTRRPLLIALNVVVLSILLYLGASLWAWGNIDQKQPTTPAIRAVFILWVILLAPWMVFAGLSGMAFDGGYTAEAYMFFWLLLTYPVSVAVAAFLRRWFPPAALLPVLNIAGCFLSPLLHK